MREDFYQNRCHLCGGYTDYDSDEDISGEYPCTCKGDFITWLTIKLDDRDINKSSGKTKDDSKG